MASLDIPELGRDDLAEMASWTILRQARALQKSGSVKAAEWNTPELTGEVLDAGQSFSPCLNLRSLTFVKNRCQCRTGRGGHVCAHALAVYLHFQAREREPSLTAAVPAAPDIPEPPLEATASPEANGPSTIRTDINGEELRVRFWLPPNLEAAAGRNAVVVKLELIPESGEPTVPEKLFKGKAYRLPDAARSVLGFVEALSGGSLHGLVQFKRDQLVRLLRMSGSGVGFAEGSGKLTILGEGDIRERLIPLLERLDETAPVKPGVRRSREIRNRLPQPPPQRPERELLPDNWMVVDGSPKFLSIMLRERDHPQYRRCAEWLRAEGFRKEPSNGKWWLRDQHKVLNFLALRKERLDRDYDPGYTRNFNERTAVIQPVPVVFESIGSGSEYTVRMELRAEGLDPVEIRSALVSGRHYIIRDDRIYLLEKAVLEKFEQASRHLGGEPNLPMTGIFQTRIGAAGLAHTEAVLEDLEMEAELPADWQERSAAIREVGKLKPPPIPEKTARRFRAYQLLGTAWLWHLHQNNLGGILADEMGLGKTIQAIGLLLSWKGDGEHEGPALVVAPASLIGNWQRELSTWGPQLEVYVHHGPSRMTEFGDDSPEADVLLTSYSTLRNDRALFEGKSFSLAIADEAQHVKNRRSHASRSLRAVHAGSRFVLTGTPIENSIEDLRALFDFCLPGYLKRPPADSRGEERNWYERQDLEKAAPYILRRGKALVAPELPDKIEQTLWCSLDSQQMSLYHSVREKTEKTLMEMAAAGASENRMRFTMLTELLRLRQVCADPGLLDPDYPLESSAKFQAFRELLSEAMDGGHRILVFSQFVKLLKRLRAWLESEEVESAYIDGSTRDRLAVCDRFNNDPTIPVCLISLKAGGTGLNLTGADTVVHFDPWWNPAVEDQATDRAHRIGQSRNVTSYKLVTEGTVEDKVLALQLKKSMLLKDLLDESALHSAKVDLSTLKSLLS